MPLAPLSLHGSIVSLEPLDESHLPTLARIGLEPELWRLQPRGANVRDMVYFSILDRAWPAVKSRLEERLARHATP
jgi:hypothetical protein